MFKRYRTLATAALILAVGGLSGCYYAPGPGYYAGAPGYYAAPAYPSYGYYGGYTGGLEFSFRDHDGGYGHGWHRGW